MVEKAYRMVIGKKKMRAQIITGRYNNDKSITLFLRGEDGVRREVKVTGFEPYFYVPMTTYIPNDDNVVRIELVETRGIDGMALKRITMRTPTDVKYFRNKFKLNYEADIPFIRRFMIDCNLKSGVEVPEGKEIVHYSMLKPVELSVKPVVTYLDVEVISQGRFPNPARKENKMVLVTLKSNNSNVYYTAVLTGENKVIKDFDKGHVVVLLQTEADLVRFIRNYLKNVVPDVITAWNVDFDKEYIAKRGELLKQFVNFSPYCVFDLLKAYKRLNYKGSNALGDVLNEERIDKKIGYEPWRYEHWERGDIERCIRINKSHVEGIVEIDKKHKLTEFFWGLKNYAGLEELEPAIFHGVIVDTLLLREYSGKFILPSKSSKDLILGVDKLDGKKVGGMVLKPKAGLYRGVGVYDMSRYYPNLLIAFNLSPEPHEKEGVLTKLAKDLLKEREKYEAELIEAKPGSEEFYSIKNRRNCVKYVAEAIIGYIGSKSSRLYSKDIFEKVTKTGQKGLTYLKGVWEEKGGEVLYADTDGIFVKIPFDRAGQMVDELNEALVDFCKSEGMKIKLTLKLDRYFSILLFKRKKGEEHGARKRYAGHVIWEGGKKADYNLIVGFEYVRRDASKLTKEVQLKIFDMILRDKKEEIPDYLRGVVHDFEEGCYSPDDIAIPKTLHKRLSDYGKGGTGMPDYVRGSIFANNYMGGDIRGGDTVKMLYVKRVKGLPPTDTICWVGNFPSRFSIEIDSKKMIGRMLKGKVEDLLELVDLTWEECVSGQRKVTDF